MSAREKQHFPSNGSYALQSIISPSIYLGWRFPARTAVAKQLPVRALCTDLCRGSTLICPVVPLNKFAIDFGHALESRQGARPAGALQRTGKHFAENQILQSLP